jgi:uncharacterized protein (TIGR02001 family)
MHHLTSKIGAGLILMSSAMVAQAELAGNISMSNNYLWRGLTQTQDKTAVSGGLDWSHDSGLYIGTWVSNVEYASDDAFSYEHDVYAGYGGEFSNGLSYDFGYLYYNYNDEANFDFSEVYLTLGYGGFSLSTFVLADTEADEADGQDFGFGEATYVSADYGFAMPSVMPGFDIGLHVGYHDGDFVDAFNFGDGTRHYADWNVSLSKGGFSFVVSGTDLDESPRSLNNDSVKYVVAYGVDF